VADLCKGRPVAPLARLDSEAALLGGAGTTVVRAKTAALSDWELDRRKKLDMVRRIV